MAQEAQNQRFFCVFGSDYDWDLSETQDKITPDTSRNHKMPIAQLAQGELKCSPLSSTLHSFRTKHMSTRSRIGIQLKDGSIRSVYHHWDGYPEWLGVKLKTFYNTKELVTKLIRGGDMSSCWTQERWTKDGGYKKVSEYGPQYYSQRGVKVPSVKDKNFEEFLTRTDNTWG